MQANVTLSGVAASDAPMPTQAESARPLKQKLAGIISLTTYRIITKKCDAAPPNSIEIPSERRVNHGRVVL
jgi:hypothetical protein